MSDKDIFSEEGELFLKDKMCICLKDLNAKILDDASDEKDFFKCLIDFFLTLEFTLLLLFIFCVNYYCNWSIINQTDFHIGSKLSGLYFFT